MNYEFADRAIRDMNRKNVRWFGRLKQLKFDELNVLSAVNKVFKDSIALALKWYLLIARNAYGKKKKNPIDDDWILLLLEEFDPVSLYQFMPEADRKRERLTEALLSTPQKAREVAKALRLWTLQTSYYAEKCVDKATLKRFEDDGVEKVRWVTAKDEKVCTECAARDGKIYPIKDLPPKPHYHCRCTFEKVM